jgi:hypothetical protein
MAGKYGIKETKEGLALVFSIMNAAGKTLEDGRVNLLDVPYWLPVASKAAPAIENFKSIWPEIKDFQGTEIEELKRWGNAEFDIPQDEFEAYFELGYAILLDLSKLVSQFQATRSKASAAEELRINRGLLVAKATPVEPKKAPKPQEEEKPKRGRKKK